MLAAMDFARPAAGEPGPPQPAGPADGISMLRFVVIATSAFLTVVDLFAAQAILPALREAYGVTPAAMSFAVNASTIGMAIGACATALLSHHVARRRGVVASLGLLAVPTLLLSLLPDLAVFTLLRALQGLCMAAAFTLTLAYLGEQTRGAGAAAAFAAYITGNVASNLVGRIIAAGVADHFGLGATFGAFACLNLAGAALAAATMRGPRPGAGTAATRPTERSWQAHLRNPRLLADFGLGFCILFAFIGTFTFVNFVLVRAPLSLGMMQVGLVYLVFLPSILTTPLAGLAVRAIGTRVAAWAALAIALAGLPLLLLPYLPAVLGGLVLVAVGTFLAQAIATGFVGRAATADRGSASGMYLASYFTGGLAGSTVLGQVFEHAGWAGCVAGIGAALVAAGLLVAGLHMPAAEV
jgi:predicted MFS family arabinose efflux permease